MLWNRADTDESGGVDLNELYLHLQTANPLGKPKGGGGGGAWRLGDAMVTGNFASDDAEGGGASDEVLLSARTANLRSEASRHQRVAALLEAAAPFLEASAHTLEAPIRRAEVEALSRSRHAEAPPPSSHLPSTLLRPHDVLRTSPSPLQARSLAHFFDDLDVDSDGRLTLPEFVLLLTLLTERASAAAKLERVAGASAPGTAPKLAAPPAPLGVREAHAVFKQVGRLQSDRSL